MRFSVFILALQLITISAWADEPPARPQPRDTHQGVGPDHSDSPPRGKALQERFQRFRQGLLDRPEMRTFRDKTQREKVHGLRAELNEELKKPKPDAALLKKTIAELGSLRDDRRREHQFVALERWGDGVTTPQSKTELEQHARRDARLHRLEFLVATERSGAARARLQAKLAELQAIEEARHEKAMATLIPERAAAGSAAPAPVPAAPNPAGVQ